MIKKTAAIISAAAMALAVAAPTLAYSGHHYRMPNKMVADVTTMTSAGANTGGNTQGNMANVENSKTRGYHYGHHSSNDVKVKGDNMMETGKAKANAMSQVAVNSTMGCGCEDDHKTSIKKAYVMTGTEAVANTGDNWQGNAASVKNAKGDVKVSGDNNMTTGKATANSNSWVVVNSQWSGAGM